MDGDVARVQALVKRGVISPEEGAERVEELFKRMRDETDNEELTGTNSPVSDGVRGKAAKQKKSQQGRKRPVILVDGLGAGTVGTQSPPCNWQTYTVTGEGTALPSTAAGAAVWLKDKSHTHGRLTVVMQSSARCIIRRCASCAPKIILGVERQCGMMWRMDSSGGWAPRVRMADARWDGEHFTPLPVGPVGAGVGQVAGRRRRNSFFSSQVEAHIIERARKGDKPNKIWKELVDEKWESLGEDERKRMAGKENVPLVMGFTLLQLQKYLERYRAAAGNGFYIENLAELKVGVIIRR